MKSIEDYLTFEYRRNLNSQAPTQNNSKTHLAADLRKAANLGWSIFPVIPQDKFAGGVEAHMGEATSDIFRIEEMVAEYPFRSGWRARTGTVSDLCALSVDAHGMSALRNFCQDDWDHWDSLTLQSQAGGTAWAFFQWPKGLVMLAAGRRPAAGLRVLGEGESCAIPPSICFSDPCLYINDQEPTAVPPWLLKLAFETPGGHSGNSRPTPKCPTRNYVKTAAKPRNGFPVNTGWQGGFRISRQS